MISNRRDLKKLLINPRAQLRYGTMFLSLTLVLHLIVTLLGIRMYMAWFTRADDTSGSSLLMTFGLILIIYAIFYFLAFVFGLLLSHRIYGPFVNINNTLEKYMAGDHSKRIQLRKGDDEKVSEVVTQINRLLDSVGGPAKGN